MSGYLLGIDIGTTGTKAKLYDLHGKALVESYMEYACDYPKPGWVEQDIIMLREALFDSLAAISLGAGKIGLNLRDIASISMASQGILHVYVDKNGELLRNGMGISWQDNRASDIVAWMRDFEDEYQRITGLPVTTFLGSAKVKWVMERCPAVYEKTAKVLTVQEYFLHCLGAKEDWYLDRSNASIFGFMEILNAEYDNWILNKFGIDKDKLPKLTRSGVMVGRLDKLASQRTGLPEGIPLCSGGLDAMCAGVGAGVIKEGACAVTLGTACVNLAALDTPKRDPDGKMILATHSLPESGWVALGIQPTAGASYKWFRDNIGMMMKMIAPVTQTDPYIMLDMHAAKAPVGSNGVLFTPSLNGKMFPEYNETASGSFIGLSLKTDFSCLARSVLEGVSFETRSVLEAYRDYLGIEEVVLTGGGAASSLWCQIQADIFNCTATVLKDNESTVMGAAILSGVGTGIFRNIKEGVEMMVHKDTPYVPHPENVRRYEELYEIFRSVYAILDNGNLYKKHSEYCETHVK